MNKGSRENNRRCAAYALFQVTGISMKNCRDAPCLLFSLLPLFLYFFALPFLLSLTFAICGHHGCGRLIVRGVHCSKRTHIISQ